MTVIEDKTDEFKKRSSGRLAEVFNRLVNEINSQVLLPDETVALTGALAEAAAAGELSNYNRQEMWEPAVLGSFRVGAIVRVREDAYPAAPPSHWHRGQRGTVTSARGGLIYVRYIGDTGGIDKVHRHKPEALEVLMTGATK
jgi:hypothetical protein